MSQGRGIAELADIAKHFLPFQNQNPPNVSQPGVQNLESGVTKFHS